MTGCGYLIFSSLGFSEKGVDMPGTEIDEPITDFIRRSRRLASMMPGDVFLVTFSLNGYPGAKNLIAMVEDGHMWMPNGELVDLKAAADTRVWAGGGKLRTFTIHLTGQFQKRQFDKKVRPFMDGPLRRRGQQSKSRDGAPSNN